MASGPITIIGIDCATQPRNTGLALAEWSNGDLTILACEKACKRRNPETIITDWIQQRPKTPTLLALDAPLGWPVALGQALVKHTAGLLLPEPPEQLFHRYTDGFVSETLQKTPLEVGASFIARTAHASLKLLDGLQRELAQPIPLAWGPGEVQGLCAIEVYPAATKLAPRFPKEWMECKQIPASVGNPGDLTVPASDHVRDAILCVLAGARFLGGKCHHPGDERLAQVRKEGWIWF